MKQVGNIAAIPSGDYRREFAMLIAGIAAATTEATPEQRDAMKDRLVGRLTTIRDMDKANRRGELDAEITECRRILTEIMGADWEPRGDNPVARAIRERGANPADLT